MKKEYKFLIIIILLLVVCLLTNNLLNKKDTIKPTPIEKENTNYIFKDKINKVSIRYFPGYNIGSAEAINREEVFVDEVSFELTGDLKEEAIRFFSKATPTTFNFHDCNCKYAVDYYEIYLNDNIKVSMGDEFGMYKKELFDIPKTFTNSIRNTMNKYNNENIYKNITGNKATIEIDNKKTELDEVELEKLLKYKYFEVHSKEDYHTYDGGPKGVIYLDDIKIYLYGNISYISNGSNSTYAIFTSNNKKDLDDFVKILIDNKNLDIKNKIKTDNIKIEYKNKKYNIDDKETIDKIYSELIELNYGKYNYLENISEKDFTNDDIKVIINNCKYYIPGSVNWGSRFFVDENNDIYDVSELSNTFTEKYIKKLINYKIG